MQRNNVSRRGLLGCGLLGVAALSARAEESRAKAIKPFPLDEIGIADLRKRFSALEATRLYLDRIQAIDRNGPTLKSVIEINPEALDIAAALDKQAKPVGPLHGVPILLKDNIDTADRMASTSGSLALVGAKPPAKDAPLVSLLRRAGAVILGKTNLSEWAEMRSTCCSGGWSGRGGLTKNPYALDRNASGSSSGSAVAVSANLCAVAVGTETSSSIVRPSSVNGIVGIKPTHGLVSQDGLIPLARSQDTAGPMARTVRDAALLLDVLAGEKRPKEGYAASLKTGGLKKKRIGVVRNFCGIHEGADALMEKAIEVLKSKDAGAEVIEVKLDDALDAQKQWLGDEYQVLLYEFKRDLNAYLATREAPRGAKIPRTLEEVIQFNMDRKDSELPYFGQDIMILAEKNKTTAKQYREKLKANRELAQGSIDTEMKAKKLHALIAPTEGPAWLTDLVDGDHFRTKSTSAAAIAGYPSISVPMGDVFGLPVGISFFGGAGRETTLIEIAYAFEQLTKHRKKPSFLATANLWG